mmetsp:Transcript_12492/g.18768  ORF Transcript_12492/g.18768 Transcript_12492/m.18768 type:complete len:158 (-) Transcript_12492:63-536(-)|eukprot:CAMPEP_0194107476 /NCGR_PEP_ID=MMETSP0150-20130528/7352_1 /TAXON_ID=122233 /ORGANISM="Chaetoceros debilis, Strain MM31A-1" /LENGTH=157 /DNA_ID=CAMNT_0038795895 /DNA_START=96 /DNA_END=569 /DNA_ORIENTATION=-
MNQVRRVLAICSGNSRSLLPHLTSYPWRHQQQSKFIHGSTALLAKVNINGSDDESEQSNTLSPVLDGLEANSRWKKGHLKKLEKNALQMHDEPLDIKSDGEVQQMWKDMESRVTKRPTMTISQAALKGKKTGRSNIKKTDEEAWLQAGLYDEGKKNK